MTTLFHNYLADLKVMHEKMKNVVLLINVLNKCEKLLFFQGSPRECSVPGMSTEEVLTPVRSVTS